MGSPNNIKNTILPPEPQTDWALFLDIDGTLIDLAPTPEAVIVPPMLPPLIGAVQAKLGGAIAMISGRTISKIDEVFSPLKLPCAGEHGSAIRLPDGRMQYASEACKFPHPVYLEACDMTKDWPGVLIEEKTYGVCLHYRLAPEYKDKIRALASALVKKIPGFSILNANMAVEIRHHALNKGSALEFFMSTPTFKGRTPVFIGDDVTDEDGMRAAEKAGGHGLHVDTCFGGQPAQVRSWLQNFVNS